jgi:mannose-1-phosphate guanylyltransferase
VQAVILAGGLGTRLRPLTETRPKPLIPILDRPMIEYTLDSLPKDVDKAIIAVSYMGDELKSYFSKRDKSKCEVVVVTEEKPLGTGGAIKNIEKHVDGTFLAFNGDVICSLHVDKMLEYHKRKRGIATIALWKVEDTTRYGVVELDEMYRIHQFREKVPKERAPSDLINAGAYALETDIFDYMDPGKAISIERDVFPLVIKRGLYGYHFEGYWVDAGTPASFLEAQGLVLKAKGGSVKCSIESKKVKVMQPVQISDGCIIGDGSVVGPNVFLGKGVHLGNDCIVQDSAIFDGSVLGNGARVCGSILGLKAKVGASMHIDKKVLGDNANFKA